MGSRQAGARRHESVLARRNAAADAQAGTGGGVAPQADALEVTSLGAGKPLRTGAEVGRTGRGRSRGAEQ